MNNNLFDYLYIVSNPKVLDGDPVIINTSIEPIDMYEYPTVKMAMADYPNLPKEAILECFHYLAYRT